MPAKADRTMRLVSPKCTGPREMPPVAWRRAYRLYSMVTRSTMPLHMRGTLGAIFGLLCVAATVGQEPAAAPKVDPAAARAVRVAPHQIKDLEMVLVRIEPGEFVMGSPV